MTNPTTSLASIRAKLQAQDTRSTTKTTGFTGDNVVYAHWNIDEGSTSRLRFLPDADPKNTFFWVEKAMINLKFAGIKGDPTSKPVTVQVPCIEMYNDGSVCPILAEVRPWYKDESLKELANSYWKKRTYLFQGFVRENTLKDDVTPPNPIRRFIISPQIFTLVKAALLDPELEEMPTDYTAGLDFQVNKTTKGPFADYSGSKYARKESALTEDEVAAIETYGLFNLVDFLPKKPSAAELDIMKEMFEASVDGQPYDTEKWGAYFRPRGVAAPAGSTPAAPAPVAESAKPVVAPVVATPALVAPVSDVPFDEDEPSEATAPIVTPTAGSGARADDILAMIRNRQAKA